MPELKVKRVPQRKCWNRNKKGKLTSMTIRPRGAPSAVTSKKTLGLDIFALAVDFWWRLEVFLTGFDLEVCSGRHLIGGVVRLLRLALTALWKEPEIGEELPGVLAEAKCCRREEGLLPLHAEKERRESWPVRLDADVTTARKLVLTRDLASRDI